MGTQRGAEEPTRGTFGVPSHYTGKHCYYRQQGS